MLKSHVSGIPCLIDVKHFYNVPPYGGSPHYCESDMDYYGYTEADYVVCDQRGRPASWLEKKMTQKDRDRILEEIKRYVMEN
jgi:hypothetical protein